MRVQSPRIPPLASNEWSKEAKQALELVIDENGETLNVFATFAQNPVALSAFLHWGTYVLFQTDLTPRQREILILRVGHLGRSGYEFAQHTRIGLEAGLGEAEIEALKQPLSRGQWPDEEHLLIQAADELLADQHISDGLWENLATHFSDQQKMDIVYVVGQYTQVCMMLNSFGVQVEDAT